MAADPAFGWEADKAEAVRTGGEVLRNDPYLFYSWAFYLFMSLPSVSEDAAGGHRAIRPAGFGTAALNLIAFRETSGWQLDSTGFDLSARLHW